jgi:phytanoyl-CoA hydroxylase
MASTVTATLIQAGTQRQDRYQVSVDEYIRYRRDGFLVVRGLVPREDVEQIKQHTDDLIHGRLPEQDHFADPNTLVAWGSGHGYSTLDLSKPPANLTPQQKAAFFLRILMLHRKLEIHERFLLHPRVLDVLEALIGPDVLAMQSMIYLKAPGTRGHGWHQDSYYLPTHPQTLIGAWMAIDAADEYNGSLWLAKGTQFDPLYPPRVGHGYGNRDLKGIEYVAGASDPEDYKNDLTKMADRHDQVLLIMQPGDVVFFGGYILHRSKGNETTDRFRRAFIGHYCNARSFTQWGPDANHDPKVHEWPAVDPVTKMSNGSHILARGDTHLPFARPRFGTACAALLPAEERRKNSEYAMAAMGNMDGGMMGEMPAAPDEKHDLDDKDGQM